APRRGGRPPRAVAVGAYAGLAGFLRSGGGEGGGNPPQGLRHADRGKDVGAGLPLSVPFTRLRRAEWFGLSREPGGVESLALNPSPHGGGRWGTTAQRCS